MFAVMHSQAPPLLEACSNDVLGLCPVARWGRGILKTRPIKRACPHGVFFNKAKEKLGDSELVIVNELKFIRLVKAPVICIIT